MDQKDQADGDVPKKSPFDNLDRDELVKKCKGLLLLAKNAKQAKDDYAEENARKASVIEKLETQKLADKESLKAMQEIVDSLTETKLETANRICDLEKSLSMANAQIAKTNEEVNALQQHAIENESLRRQIQRLTDENEELISEMEQLEAKSKGDHLADIANCESLKLENEKLRETVVNNEKFMIKLSDHQEQFDKIALELQASKETNDKLVVDLSALSEHSRKQADKLKLYKSKIVDISAKLKQLKSNKEVLAKIVAEYSQSVTKWQADIIAAMKQIGSKSTDQPDEVTQLQSESAIKVEISDKLESAEKAIHLLQATNDELTSEIEDLKKQLADHDNLMLEKSQNEESDRGEDKKTIAELQTQCSRLNEDNQKLAAEIEHIRSNHEVDRQSSSDDFECEKSKFLNDIDTLNRTLNEHQSKLNALSDANADLINKLEERTVQVNEKTAELNDLNGALEQLQQKRSQETDELLSEMREINEALKNRGDVISKQKQSIGELNDKIDRLQTENAQLNVANDAANKQVDHLNDRVKELESKSFVDDSQMSVSTISRAEEVNRMRDIEEGFEEKYNKLRVLAVKLKKKVGEQASIIQSLESRNNDNTTEGQQITSKLGVMEVQVKNLQLLQSENDRLLDELETVKSNWKRDQVELDKSRMELDKVANELIELKCTEAQSDVKKVNSSQAIKEYVKQIQALKDENSENLVNKKSLENELIKLKGEVNAKDKEINSLKEVEKSLRAEQTKIKMSLKQTNVLSLEMDAYEKSLNEATQKLETMNVQTVELKSTISSHENSIETLKSQIKFLEENLESERQHSIDLKEQINLQQLNMKEAQHSISELKIQNDLLSKEKNSTILDLEEFRLDTAKNISEKEKIIRLLQAENEKNIRQVCEQQEQIDQMKAKLAETEQELVDAQTEFSSYKVRAQSVLRNNQTKESSREKELDEELNSVRITNDSLNTKIASLSEQNRKMSADFDAIKQERDHLKDRCKELLRLLDESRQQIDDIQEQNRSELAERQETLKSQRLQIDTLTGCYKKQVAELEEKYLKEIEDLKRNNTSRIDEKMSQSTADNRNVTKSMLTDEQQIDWILMERQAGEGSENTTNSNFLAQRNTSSAKGRRDLIPLDELLNNSFDETAFSTDRSISPTIELETTKAKLTVQESSVKHLTSLLAEAEQDLVKLTQLNDVLKEELRRQERSTAREQHLHNLEYLKNVIFKFLTINCGDEKSHLVPVLNTILKLSPEETQKLERAARGEGQRKWGSYLPGWSGNQ
ncbi:GRIP and coiled-coil domain-containing protein 2 [Bradysia coprophila]|uniref:GRIP and coiled-coil domain-containing protein 2 n=1 Tax=Bradysia coprophila TaxID=38358 RepID=UPI00187DA4F3|nr:GRIP and coiled-coil domain-containing protein 2 [Bradysia coprophila]